MYNATDSDGQLTFLPAWKRMATALGPRRSAIVAGPPLRRSLTPDRRTICVAEFFAGMGLVRMAAEQEGARVVFANDIDPTKHDLYASNFSASEFVCDDIRNISGDEVPSVHVATASFPCTDVSLAGNRAGLAGKQSGTLWKFLRILSEMGDRRPQLVLLENVVGFATSHNGSDLRAIINVLGRLGYNCDLLELNAKRFVPQSRPRLFIVASLRRLSSVSDWTPRDIRPQWIKRFVQEHPELRLQALSLPSPPVSSDTVASIAERFPPDSPRWWDRERTKRFLSSLSALNSERLRGIMFASRREWATAYRRTRSGTPVWEIRKDGLSGCLRTARGGSSRQAIVEAGCGHARVRWMTAREYARLQGAPGLRLDRVSENQAIFALGDAVCVPVVRWIFRNYLVPMVEGRFPTIVMEKGLLSRNDAKAISIRAT